MPPEDILLSKNLFDNLNCLIVQLANFIDLVENNRFEYINSFYTLAIDYFKLILHYEINHRIYNIFLFFSYTWNNN